MALNRVEPSRRIAHPYSRVVSNTELTGWILRASDGPPALTVTRSENDYEYEWTARLELRDAAATAKIFERYSGDALRLDAFFASLAERWRGWEGTLSWEATGMKMGAEHDGLGHVTLTVEIWADPHLADRWTLRGIFMLDAGSLDRIAREAKATDSLSPG